MNNKATVILTNSIDTHAHILVPEIERLKGKVYRFDTDRLHTHFQLNLHPEKASFSLETPVGTIESENIFSLWIRRPYDFAFDVTDPKSKFIKREIVNVIRSISQYVPKNTLIVDHPEAVNRASNKIPQLKDACKFNLKIPDSIITNSPTIAKQFMKKHRRNVIVKPISIGTTEYGNQAFTIFTKKVDNSLDLSLVRNCPTLFQENIRKKSELRITIIGNKVFAVELDSQKIPEAQTDWRQAADKIGKIPHKVVKLPHKIEKSLIDLKNYYGLNFGAIDMAKNEKGEYIFFELNPAGQFLWLDQVTDLNMAKEMAMYLLGLS